MTSKRVATSREMVVSRNKNKVLSSTPEHRLDSPSRDSDSLYDSDAASPVPFLCTQDGTEGETDVIWNHYTPKSSSHRKNSTPLRRRSKKSIIPKILERPIPKRRNVRPTQKKTELFQELIELNQNLHELINHKAKNSIITEKLDSDNDIFNESPEYSPKSCVKNNSCLRKNVLSSKFAKPEIENGLESDDSMNECLLKASQMVEENILKNDDPKKKYNLGSVNNKKNISRTVNFKMDQDSMDAILNSIQLESPCAKRLKKCNSPQINNDSFDNYVGNLNESALDRLTQIPTKNQSLSNVDESSILESAVDFTSSFSKSIFGRHSSMPESPNTADIKKPSTSGMVFGRYKSMPSEKNIEIVKGDSPIRCTPDDIKKKHQLAREKLLAKRQLPFTSTQKNGILPQIPEQAVNKCKFQPKVPSAATFDKNKINVKNTSSLVKSDTNSNNVDIKSIIEKKRQEALMKLRQRKHIQNRVPELLCDKR